MPPIVAFGLPGPLELLVLVMICGVPIAVVAIVVFLVYRSNSSTKYKALPVDHELGGRSDSEQAQLLQSRAYAKVRVPAMIFK
ncbi:MAG: hypothetical protein P8N76_11315 [Pirellulaceae bacterium]|nr:hypothetical protein [Pirellulaceae bacterium]